MGALIAVYWISVVLTVLTLIHALTRSERDWLAADRSKSYWVTGLVVGALFGPFGVIVSIVYLVAVVAKMSSTPRSPGPFDKR
jgi:hypothetical protein